MPLNVNVELNTLGVSVLTALNTLTTVAITGNLSVGGDFSNPSDARIKKDIKPLPPQLHLIRKLKACSYLKIPANKNEVGFIAQELKEIFPELVVTRKVGEIDDFHEVLLTQLIPVLVKGVQELVELVNHQGNEIKALKEKIDAS